jgi:signal transduction histidine kinase
VTRIAAKDEFLAMLSHELRNPLAAIKMSLFVEGRAASAEQARRAKAVLGRQVDQLTRIVDDLLDVTRITQNKIRLERRVLDLDDLALHTVEDHRLLFERSNVALEQIRAPSPVLVDGDASRLAQTLGNLLHNAAKFTPPDGVTRVEVQQDAAAGQAILRVSDSGVGMTKRALAHVFQPFMGETYIEGVASHDGPESCGSRSRRRVSQVQIPQSLAEVGGRGPWAAQDPKHLSACARPTTARGRPTSVRLREWDDRR